MKNIILIILVAFTCFGCERLEQVKTPSFDVTTSKEIYDVNDTIDFNFMGKADIIALYSGEEGNEYDSISGRVMSTNYRMDFESAALDGAQEDQFSIFITKDFDEDYTIEGINKATLIDVSNKVRFAGPSDNRAWVNSGDGDITEFLGSEKSTEIYVVIKHEVKDQTVNGNGNLNRIRNFKLQAENKVGTSTVFAHSPTNWTLFSTPNKMANRASIESSQMTLRAGYGTYATENTIDWVVSSVPIKIEKELDLGPDRSLAIKSLADKMPKNFQKVYTTPGKYKVVFRAINRNVDGKKEKVKVINLTILPKV